MCMCVCVLGRCCSSSLSDVGEPGVQTHTKDGMEKWEWLGKVCTRFVITLLFSLPIYFINVMCC